jgi:predicted nucleic acid-binding protein
MTILDTNVISEALKPLYSPTVKGWLANQPSHGFFTTSVTQAEILFGIELMAPGKRRDSLLKAASVILYEFLAERILPFDTAAAPFYAEIMASRRRSGRPIDKADAQIAAIARAHGYSLATRNTGDFADCGLALINPWEG